MKQAQPSTTVNPMGNDHPSGVGTGFPEFITNVSYYWFGLKSFILRVSIIDAKQVSECYCCPYLCSSLHHRPVLRAYVSSPEFHPRHRVRPNLNNLRFRPLPSENTQSRWFLCRCCSELSFETKVKLEKRSSFGRTILDWKLIWAILDLIIGAQYSGDLYTNPVQYLCHGQIRLCMRISWIALSFFPFIYDFLISVIYKLVHLYGLSVIYKSC